MVTFLIQVGYTLQRPPVPDEYVSRVQVSADRWIEASLIAALMVWSRVRGREGMVTSTLLLETDD